LNWVKGLTGGHRGGKPLRPDLPAWLQAALGRAIAIDPAERIRDMTEFAVEIPNSQ